MDLPICVSAKGVGLNDLTKSAPEGKRVEDCDDDKSAEVVLEDEDKGKGIPPWTVDTVVVVVIDLEGAYEAPTIDDEDEGKYGWDKVLATVCKGEGVEATDVFDFVAIGGITAVGVVNDDEDVEAFEVEKGAGTVKGGDTGIDGERRLSVVTEEETTGGISDTSDGMVRGGGSVHGVGIVLLV